MKKIIILLIFPILLTGCIEENKKNVNIITTNEEEPEAPEIPSVPEYVDENPVEISLYIDAPSGGMQKSESEYHTSWIMKNDIVVFGSLFCNDDSMPSDHYQNLWANCASKYEDSTKYKVGWELKFTLKDGTSIDQMIYKPSDVSYFYDYLEIYLYDSANAKIGAWYSHLLDEEMTESTIMTSMKLTAGSKFEEIASPIEVTVFTYDTEDDFTESGHYRGKSSYKVTVYND